MDSIVLSVCKKCVIIMKGQIIHSNASVTISLIRIHVV